jgi:D-xylose transport system ATP-binding protein
VPVRVAEVHDTPAAVPHRTPPLVEMRDISIAFGGIKAVDHATVDLYPGEVVGLLGHNGAGKSTLIKVLSGAYKRDAGRSSSTAEKSRSTIRATPRRSASRRSTRRWRSPTMSTPPPTSISAANCGRRFGTLDDVAMEAECRKVMHRLNPNFRRFKEPVKSLSGGQRQSVAIARAIHFNARILIMDEPTAALGPQETAQVGRTHQAAEGRGHRHLPHQPRPA